jgi:hypothetical protein
MGAYQSDPRRRRIVPYDVPGRTLPEWPLSLLSPLRKKGRGAAEKGKQREGGRKEEYALGAWPAGPVSSGIVFFCLFLLYKKLA